MRIKSETEQETKKVENYLEVICDKLVSLNFSNTLNFKIENMYRFSLKLRERKGGISLEKNTMNVRVMYLDISDKKVANRGYNWFHFRTNTNWEHKNIIILPPDNNTHWNRVAITIFFEPGQYDIKDMLFETLP